MMAERAKCPKCGAEVFASDDVCMDCGADLVAARQEREPPPARPAAEPEPEREPRREQTPAPEAEEPSPLRWLWVPAMRGSARYPILRAYQYVCMLSAWGSLITGVATVGMLIIGWMDLRRFVGGVPAGLDAVALAATVGVIVLWSIFWAFTLRALVEGIQVYLDIESNTRRSAELAEAEAAARAGEV